MSVLNENLLLGAPAAASGGVSRSLRFSSGDSSYLSRTPASAGNRKTWTWAGWVKKVNNTTSRQFIFNADVTSNNSTIEFKDNAISVFDYNSGAYQWQVVTNALFRDNSAWMHLVVAVDTTQGTAANRVKIYVNGTQQTFSTANYPTQDYQSKVNAAVDHRIGSLSGDASFNLDAYLADCYLIDGQQLDPTSFGEFDATTGVWNPKAYTGSYGTNGFHLEFADNASLTTSSNVGIGKDTSGNGNYWVSNNLQVTDQSNYVSGSSTYRQSTSANQNWNSSSSASSTSSALSPDRIFWVDLGSSKSFNKVTFTCVGANNSGNYASNFIVYYSTSGSSTGSSICNSGCTITKIPTTSGPIPGTITVEFSGISAVSGQYIGITNGTGSDSGTYTYSNFQVALSAPAGNDSLVDVPSSTGTDNGLGGEVRGNYCTWNPLAKNSVLTLANGNLDDSTGTPGTDGIGLGTIGASVGKFYWELTVNSTAGSNNPIIGVVPTAAGLIEVGSSNTNSVGYLQSGSKRINGSTSSYGNSFTTGDVVGVALDLDNGAIYFSKNGTWQNSGVPTSGSSKTGAAHTWSGGSVEMTPAIREYNSGCSANWGQRSWAYSAPSGYKAFCTTNLSAPSVTKPSTVFETVIWTGDGNNNRTISTPFSPDFVWAKFRNQAYSHGLFDTVRGADLRLRSNGTNAEDTVYLDFASNGFIVDGSTSFNDLNDTFVGWCWDAGSSTVTNTAGSISSEVRANATAGFSIVTYTGNGTSGATVGHGLGVAPSFLVVKRRNVADSWLVYTKETGATKYLLLNNTTAATTYSGGWNDTAPTSTVFSLGNDVGVNANTGTYVAYCFAPVAGYSSFGSYTGNGSADGPFVYTGFRPRWLMWKVTQTTGNYQGWYILDAARDPYNESKNRLHPNASSSEATMGTGIDLLSNGFKLRSSDTDINGSYTYIYAAFAESPFNYARAR